jgi:cysteine-rich repeat protein
MCVACLNNNISSSPFHMSKRILITTLVLTIAIILTVVINISDRGSFRGQIIADEIAPPPPPELLSDQAIAIKLRNFIDKNNDQNLTRKEKRIALFAIIRGIFRNQVICTINPNSSQCIAARSKFDINGDGNLNKADITAMIKGFQFLELCGNGIKAVTEACDDGNTVSGNGCSSTCAVEPGWTCNTETPNVCTQDGGGSVCGNGTKEGTEACDDGDTDSGDGCSNLCDVENGYQCNTESPNVCTQIVIDAICGNGIKQGTEACDDGDTDSGDGCSNQCAQEDNFRCETLQGQATSCISYLNYVKTLADTNTDGTVSDDEAVELIMQSVEATDKPYADVKKFDVDLDGDVDDIYDLDANDPKSDVIIIIEQLDILAP